MIAYAYTSAVSVILYCYMIQDKSSHRHSLCNVVSHVVLFACKKHTVGNILQKKLYCEFKSGI